MLKINHDKTQMTISCKNCYRPIIYSLTFDVGRFVIHQEDNVIVLGFIIQNNLNHDKQISATLSSCYFKLHCLNQITKYLNVKKDYSWQTQ